jgi:Cu/Ag efflux protein CusF
MKRAASVVLIAFILLSFAGAALAGEMSGEVVAVDAAKGALALKSGSVTAGFDCEKGSLIKEVKVGDKVTVQYKEEGGKKIATKVTPVKKQVSVGC